MSEESKKIEKLEAELKELRQAAKGVYQLIHYMEGRIRRLKNAIFSEKK
jgi:uncharacterized protein (UPF0335 family)